MWEDLINFVHVFLNNALYVLFATADLGGENIETKFKSFLMRGFIFFPFSQETWVLIR